MDPREASLYQLYVVTLLVIVGLAVYYLIFALRFRSRYRRAFDERLEAEINKLESEKTRIAQDLHDETGPILTAIKMRLELIHPANQKEIDSLEKCVEYIDSLTSKTRNISIGLMPSVLQDKGLVIGIEQYIHSLNYENNVNIKYRYENLPPISLHQSLHVFRIVQEIIHNTFKHSDARDLNISITEEEENIIVATADNGKGFTPDLSVYSNQGYGLGNIQNRVQTLNGRLSIDSAPGKGTRYYIEIPLRP